MRQQPSHPHSPDMRGEAGPGMQETTIIAQISGLRKTDLFDDLDQNDEVDESFISHHIQ